MTECEVLLAEANAKKESAMNREAKHAVACAILSEATMHLIETITPHLTPALTPSHAKRLLGTTIRVLARAHEQSLLAQDGRETGASYIRSQDTPFIWATIREFVDDENPRPPASRG